MRIGIIGTGMVGSAIAFSLATNRTAEKLILIDHNKERAVAEAMDISHAAPFSSGSSVITGDYENLKDTDIIIITAGASQKPGESRFNLLNKNVDIFKNIIPQAVKYAPNAILLIATNPVDIMTEIALKLSGLPKSKVFGTGTVLDSSRFRSTLGKYLGISPTSVHANVIGEHGDSEVLLWSGAVAGTTQIYRIAEQLGKNFDKNIKDTIDKDVRNAAYTIINGKGSTYYGIAAATQHIINSIMANNHMILTVSSHHEHNIGNYPNICYSMPSIISRNGIEKTLIPVMNENEQLALTESNKTLLEYTKKALSLL